jgi:hypothetical protein
MALETSACGGSAPMSNSRASWSRTSPVPSRFEGDRDYLPGDAGEERDAVLGNSRRPLVVCDQCNRTNPAIALHSACANSESQQPVCCAASPTGSGFAGFGLFSRIIPRGYQSSGQSSTERFSRPAQAPASHNDARAIGRRGSVDRHCLLRVNHAGHFRPSFDLSLGPTGCQLNMESTGCMRRWNLHKIRAGS